MYILIISVKKIFFLDFTTEGSSEECPVCAAKFRRADSQSSKQNIQQDLLKRLSHMALMWCCSLGS